MAGNGVHDAGIGVQHRSESAFTFDRNRRSRWAGIRTQARPDEFHLYRVFNFGPDARLYMLAGELSKSCHLDPTQYRAFVHIGQASTSE
jgi:phosphodiesterase/alkaline phosphatase D-like protein